MRTFQTSRKKIDGSVVILYPDVTSFKKVSSKTESLVLITNQQLASQTKVEKNKMESSGELTISMLTSLAENGI